MGLTNSVVTIGLKGIEIADIANDGGPGTVFKKFGNVSTDSFAFAESEPTLKQVLIEESSYSLKDFRTKGQLIATANIADPDTEMYAEVRGGTISTATAGQKIYSEGDEFVNVEKTVKIFPAEGLSFQLNRASLSGLITGGLGKNQELYLVVSISAMQPLKAGTKVMQVIETVPES